MKNIEINFCELKKLSPTLSSTIFKMVEESGELSRAVLSFYPYLHVKKDFIDKNEAVSKIFNNIIEELLDVGQTATSMLFVFENTGQLNKYSLESILQEHLSKLIKKGYDYNQDSLFYVRKEDINGIKTIKMAFPRLNIKTDLIKTCLKISEEAGELVQFAGKNKGLSGELVIQNDLEVNKGILLELFDVAQCCVTMLYLLVEKYNIDVDSILKKHNEKLKSHGYM